jgi:stage V sporulation protein B
VKLLGVGLVIKIITNYTLVGIPEVNILGAGTGSLLCYLIATVLELYFLFRVTKIRMNYFAIFFKPLLASLLSIGFSYLIFRAVSVFISEKIAVCFAMVLAVVLYAVCVLWFRILSKHDISMLPKGQKIVKILENHNLIR